jgi:hypothetical protein
VKIAIAASGLVLGLAASVGAGEIVLKNGSRIAGELASETLLLSTKAGALEVASGQVRTLTLTEVRLKDGRVIQGAVVGQTIRARTPLGELAIKVDEFTSFKADVETASAAGFSGAAAPAAPQTPSPVSGGKAPATSSTASLTPVGTAFGPLAGPGPAPADPSPAPPATTPQAAAASAPPTTQVVIGAKTIGQGFETTAKGIGRTVVDGADTAHDGIKGFGLKVWDVMKGVGQVFQNAFGS